MVRCHSALRCEPRRVRTGWIATPSRNPSGDDDLQSDMIAYVAQMSTQASATELC